MIKKEKQREVRALLKSSFFKELQKCYFSPPTSIDIDNEANGELILRHERAPFILLPGEWTFSMLKTVALRYCDLFDLCQRHAVGLIDGHASNMVFFGNEPRFVDLGSFVDRSTSSQAMDEFMSLVVMPLVLWSQGRYHEGHWLVSAIFNQVLPEVSFETIGLLALRHQYAKPAFSRGRDFCVGLLGRIGRRLGLKVPVPDAMDVRYVRRMLESLPVPSTSTTWSSYRLGYGNTGVPERFGIIAKILQELDWMTCVDLAGNDGFLVSTLAKQFPSNKFLSLDYDSNACDMGYCQSKSASVTYGLLNVFRHRGDAWMPLVDRCSGDVVLALALVHHLILSQKIDASFIVNRLAEMSRRYIFVEFMPLGLWDGKDAPPVPAWYTAEWFEGLLHARMEVLRRENLGPNRLLFVCRKFV
jgi:hypothetical protein